MSVEDSNPLRRPPTFTLIAGLLLMLLGTATGTLLVSFQDVFFDKVRREVIRRPEIHGFSGSEIIDQNRIAEIIDLTNIALRLLHTHSFGLAILILITSVIIANLPLSSQFRFGLCVFITIGARIPVGWLVLVVLIPIWGIDSLRTPIEWTLFLPSSLALIVSILSALIIILFRSRFCRSADKS